MRGLAVAVAAAEWKTRGYCAQRGQDFRVWESTKYADQDLAAHGCMTHCTVQDECALKAEHVGGQVIAGVRWASGKGNTVVPAKRQPKETSEGCRTCHPTT